MTADAKDRLAFLMGLGSITSIRVVGSGGITEFVCLICAPFVFLRMLPVIRKTPIRWILWGNLGWLASALVTDFLYRHSRMDDALRGCGSVLFLLTSTICVFAVLFDDIMRLRWYLTGMALSSVISIFAFQSGVVEGRLLMGMAPEKVFSYKTLYFAVVQALVTAAVAWLYARQASVALLLMAATPILHLINGSRSMFLSGEMAAIISWGFVTSWKMSRRTQRNLTLTMVAFTLIMLQSFEMYRFAVMRGYMGDAERAKYEEQAGTKYGLLSGRAEFFAGFAAVRDSPILGHGSWAMDTQGYYRSAFEFFGRYEDADRFEEFLRQKGQYTYMSAHSYIWQGWVWHGLLGGLFWIIVLILLIRYLGQGIHLCRPLIAANAVLVLMGCWNILFSPFSERSLWGARFVVMVMTFAEIERRKYLNRNGIFVDKDAPWDGKARRAVLAWDG